MKNISESEKELLKTACFIKIGCIACQNNMYFQYRYYGQKYVACKDEYLSYKEKVDKIL